MEYDLASKRLVEIGKHIFLFLWSKETLRKRKNCKESLLRWLAGIEVGSADLLEELPKEIVSLRSSDFPLLVRDVVCLVLISASPNGSFGESKANEKEGLEQIVLLEFQTQWEVDFPLRLLDYYARFKMKYHTRVTPIVLLFRKHGGAKDSYTDEVVSLRCRKARNYYK